MGREYFILVSISARWSRSHSVEVERLQIVCLNSSTQRGMQLIRLSVGVSDERVVTIAISMVILTNLHRLSYHGFLVVFCTELNLAKSSFACVDQA